MSCQRILKWWPQVNDPDGDLATTQLSVTKGTLTVSLAEGATISAGAIGTSTLTLSGTQDAINATLGAVSYQGNLNYNGNDTLTMLSSDNTGTPLTDTDTVAITVFIDTDGDGIGNHVDTDDDGDGFSDILEVRFNGDPLDPSDRDNLEASIISDMDIAEGTIQQLQAQVAALSLRPTLEQVRDGRPGSVLLSVDSEAGAVVLDFTVEESEDLITWTPGTRGEPDPHPARGQAVLPVRTLMLSGRNNLRFRERGTRSSSTTFALKILLPIPVVLLPVASRMQRDCR